MWACGAGWDANKFKIIMPKALTISKMLILGYFGYKWHEQRI